jgi:hypothetical protein
VSVCSFLFDLSYFIFFISTRSPSANTKGGSLRRIPPEQSSGCYASDHQPPMVFAEGDLVEPKVFAEGDQVVGGW